MLVSQVIIVLLCSDAGLFCDGSSDGNFTLTLSYCVTGQSIANTAAQACCVLHRNAHDDEQFQHFDGVLPGRECCNTVEGVRTI